MSAHITPLFGEWVNIQSSINFIYSPMKVPPEFAETTKLDVLNPKSSKKSTISAYLGHSK